MLESSSQKMVFIELAPLTNIAELFRKYPHLVEKIEEIHVMGGAVEVPGNLLVIEGNKVAEWNIFADPLAAKEVLETGVPVTLISLDVTNQAPVTQKLYEYARAHRQTPASFLFYDLLTSVFEEGYDSEFYLWDVVAVEVLLDPSLIEYEQRRVDIITEEGPCYGQTILSENGFPIRVSKAIDYNRFIRNYFQTINAEFREL